MGQHSPAEGVPAGALEAQIRESFGRVVYSHKTHEKCADLLSQRLSRIKVLQIVLSALTTGGLVAAIFGSDEGSIGGLVVSTLLLALNAYTKDLDLGEMAQKHREAATDLWLIREEYLSLLTDLRTGAGGVGDFQSRRDELLVRLHAVYHSAPGTNSRAYAKAQKALKQNEELTFSDEEIDAFLPAALRHADAA